MESSMSAMSANRSGTAAGTVCASAAAPLETRAITVRQGRLVIDVALPNPALRYCTPALADRLTGRFPDLPHHACVNGAGDTFAAVMQTTDLAHVLEHLTISYLVREAEVDDACFTGTTEWTDEAAGLARIQVSFTDDLAALRAYNQALAALLEELACA